MTAIPHGRPPFRHPGCSGHCAAQNPTPLSTLKFHDWRSSGRRFAGHFVSGYTDDVRFGSKADMCNATTHVRFTPIATAKADMYRKGHVCFSPGWLLMSALSARGGGSGIFDQKNICPVLASMCRAGGAGPSSPLGGFERKCRAPCRFRGLSGQRQYVKDFADQYSRRLFSIEHLLAVL